MKMKSFVLLLFLPLFFTQVVYNANKHPFFPVDSQNFTSNVSYFIAGVFVGLGRAETATPFFSCGPFIDDFLNVEQDLMIELFENKKGYLSIELLEEVIMSFTSNCVSRVKEHVPGDLNAIYSTMLQPGFSEGAKQRFLGNFSLILDLMINGVKLAKEFQFLQSGTSLGKIFAIILGPVSYPPVNITNHTLGLGEAKEKRLDDKLLSSLKAELFEKAKMGAPKRNQKNFTNKIDSNFNGMFKVLRFFGGLTASFLNIPHSAPDLKYCVKNITSFKNKTIMIIQELEEGHIIGGLTDLVHVLNDTLNSCSSLKNELNETITDFTAFTQSKFLPILLHSRIKDNIDDLVEYWYDGIDSFKEEKYFHAGKKIGKIPSILWSGPNGTSILWDMIAHN